MVAAVRAAVCAVKMWGGGLRVEQHQQQPGMAIAPVGMPVCAVIHRRRGLL